MKLELLTIDERGTGSFLVHMDDGRSFEQHFTDAPVEDETAFREHLTRLADAAVARQAPTPSKPVAQTVRDLIGQKVDVVRPVRSITEPRLP